jgi:hypothetical protein
MSCIHTWFPTTSDCQQHQRLEKRHSSLTLDQGFPQLFGGLLMVPIYGYVDFASIRSHDTIFSQLHMFYSGSWALGFMGCWPLGHLSSWALGLLGTGPLGHLGCWALGLLGTWPLGHLASWAHGLLGCWALGLLASWALGLLASWALGLLGTYVTLAY